MNELLRLLIRYRLHKKGFNETVAWSLAQGILDDLFHNKNYTFRKRLWAIRKGFRCDKLGLYGLTESNYRNYLSDFGYDWLNPHNGTYSQWIDNKLVFKYILKPFSANLPEYYYQISKRGIHRLVDCPNGYDATIEDIIKLLRNRGSLAAKMVLGTGGLGFYKLSYANHEYFLNDQPRTEFEILRLIENWRLIDSGYVLTEHLTSHTSLRKIWAQSANALRIGIIRQAADETKIAFAYCKFGVSTTGMVDNISRGGIFSLIDINNGRFKNYKRIVDGHYIEHDKHPDSGVLVEGNVPYWQEIKAKLLEISDFLPQYRFVGMDVVVLQEGFKIVEINPQPSIINIQAYIPVHSDELMHSFFQNLTAGKKMMMESQEKHHHKKVITGISEASRVGKKLIDTIRSGSRSRRLNADIALVESSDFFDRQWYVNQYAELQQSGDDPLRHYLNTGGFNGFDPGPNFNSQLYLDLYNDVKLERMNPLVHYLRFGKFEGRIVKK